MLNYLKLCIHFTQIKTYKVTEKDIENVSEDSHYLSTVRCPLRILQLWIVTTETGTFNIESAGIPNFQVYYCNAVVLKSVLLINTYVFDLHISSTLYMQGKLLRCSNCIRRISF